MPSRGLMLTYHIIKTLIRTVMLLLSRASVRGRELVPRSGGAVVVCNHLSGVDAAVLVGVFPRPLVLMSKVENYRGVLKFFMRLVGAFTVRRGQIDREALRTAERALAAGRLLCIFPEGTRGGGALVEAHGGAAMLAIRTGAPIIPVAITGTPQIFLRRFPWLGFPRVTVTIGEPFLLGSASGAPRRDERERMTEEIMARIAALLPLEMRGRYSHA
ncbi:MAG: lysophospholipid acyltransferase family protein [Roseiflexaceae bacterium]